jgi:Protein of unknown function (DUF3040)
MSLSTWERQALDSIGDGFAASDPRLASLLITFSQLARGGDASARGDPEGFAAGAAAFAA